MYATYQALPLMTLMMLQFNINLSLHTGFIQKSDCGFPDFSTHLVYLYVNKNSIKLTFKR